MRTASYKTFLWGYAVVMGALTAACLVLWPGAAGAILIYACTAGLLTALVCYGVRRELRETLGSIRRAMDAAASDEPGRRVPIQTGSQAEKMQRSFNLMADRLQASLAELRDLQAKLERYQALAEIGEVSASLAHEIASPLDAAQDGLGLLRKKVRADAETRELLEMIEASLCRVEAATRRLLSLARPAPGVATRVDLRDPIEQALKTVSGRFRRQNIAVQYDRPARSVPIVGDPDLLTQALVNLFTNAADAMLGGGRLRLATTIEGGDKTVTIRISDTGCGIPPEQLGRVFEPFYSTKGARAGTGLGLAITKRIIEACSGRIDVESRPGGGTCFVITLPLSGPAAAEPARHSAPSRT